MVLLTPGRELKVLMAMRGLTARDVAERAGMKEWELSRIVRDHRAASPESLEQIRAAIFAAQGDSE